MRKLSLVLAAVLLAATASVATAAHTWNGDFGPGRDATQAGKIVINEVNANQFKVTIDMTPRDATTPQPAHIHVGGCPGVGAVAYPLTNVVNGKSETTINASLRDVLSRQHSINVHRSAAEVNIYTACVDLPAGTVLNLGPGRDATQAGYVVIAERGAQTKVSLVMVPGTPPTTAQPAHIHAGTCPGVGAVAFPLSNVVNGSSETTVNASWAQIQAAQHSINTHRSAAEVGIYTACVNLPVAQRAAAPTQLAPTQLPRTGAPGLGLVALLGTAFAGIGVALRRR